MEKDAQELADSMGVKIFQADIIYHLFDKFMAYRDELKQKKREEFKNIAVFPCKLRVLPQFVFNSRDPIVCGVMVEAGIVKEGTPLCVPTKEVGLKKVYCTDGGRGVVLVAVCRYWNSNQHRKQPQTGRNCTKRNGGVH